MASQWFILKDKVIKLRKEGTSIGVINKEYGIPKSTLSSWFRKIKLNKYQKGRIYKQASIKMENARKKAVLWHNNQKKIRLNQAKTEAFATLNKLDLKDKNIIELALSFLYLEEGAKTKVTSLGNTNPLILKFFITSINLIYKNVRISKCELHLRSDQDAMKEIKYWSNELKMPIDNFGFVKDKRKIKSPTYQDYHGVCVIRFNNIAIQRRLVFLSNEFCNIITNMDD